MTQFEGHKLISDQIDSIELTVIVRELRRVLEALVEGDAVEFGCFVGTTSLFLQRSLETFPRTILGKPNEEIASPKPFQGLSLENLEKPEEQTKLLWLYDSFEGLPEKSKQDSSPAGLQFKTGELSASKKQLILNFKKAGLRLPKIKKAWFSELSPDDLPDKICFAFLDGDYYESIKDSLKLIWPKLSKGSVVIVDDYTNEALPGAATAVREWLVAHKASLKVESSLAILSKE